MTWVKTSFPYAYGLDKLDPVRAKRFFTTNLRDLVSDVYGYVKSFMSERKIDEPSKAIAFVIKEIDYPFNIFGLPDDSHYLVAFGGNFVAAVVEDYWSADYETLMTYTINSRIGRHGYGDCEDTSILLCSMLQELGIECFVNFGFVYRGANLLGGHAWVTANLPSYGWALIETTLDEPLPYPSGWPRIDPSTNIYVVGDLSYVAVARFNRRVFEAWIATSVENNVNDPHKSLGYAIYSTLTFREKERKEKFEAIERAFGKPTKLRRVGK